MIKLTQQGAPYSLVEKATPICYQGNYALLPWQIRLSQMGILDTWFVRLLSISTVRMVRVLRPNEIASYCRSSQISQTPTHISAISHYAVLQQACVGLLRYTNMCVRATIFSSKTTIDLPKYSHPFIQPTDITKKLDFFGGLSYSTRCQRVVTTIRYY